MKGHSRDGLLYFAPAGAVFLVLMGYPLLQTALLSFRHYNWFTRKDTFVGLANYARLLSDPSFWDATLNSLVWTLGSLAGQVLLGGLIALLVDMKLRGVGFFRSLFLLPWVLPTVVTALAWRWLYHEFWGLIPYSLQSLGLTAERLPILGRVETAMAGAILVNVWRGFPLMMINFLAALQSIPAEVYEAAKVDGASPFRCLVHITLPLLRQVALVLVVFRTIWIFNFFDLIWLLTRGGPASATQTLPIMVYLKGFGAYQFGEASAVAMIMLVMLTLLMSIYFRLAGGVAR